MFLRNLLHIGVFSLKAQSITVGVIYAEDERHMSTGMGHVSESKGKQTLLHTSETDNPYWAKGHCSQYWVMHTPYLYYNIHNKDRERETIYLNLHVVSIFLNACIFQSIL